MPSTPLHSIPLPASRRAAAVALCALSLGLAACGGSSGTVSVTPAGQTTSGSSSASASPSSASPSSAPSTAASSTTSSSPSSSSTDSTAKPTKAQTIDGLTKALAGTTKGAQISPTVIKKASTCIVDKTYDKVSNKTLRAFASGDPTQQLDAADNTVYKDAAVACGKQLGLRK
ncbi:MAG: hypothetical protein M3Y49_04270 [Actinomycetota bacterium]|nr:hypothetical protein [Actinomycetota bacterium]